MCKRSLMTIYPFPSLLVAKKATTTLTQGDSERLAAEQQLIKSIEKHLKAR